MKQMLFASTWFHPTDLKAGHQTPATNDIQIPPLSLSIRMPFM
jgi:hypothetical protein